MRALVPEVQRQLSPPRGDDAGAQLRRSSHNHLEAVKKSAFNLEISDEGRSGGDFCYTLRRPTHGYS